MFSNLILRNSRRSRKENGLFFSSLIISVVAFYIILSISTQDVMIFLRKMESDAVNRLLLMIPVLYMVTLGILFFLIYFACKYQLQRRRHEFGVYLMLGMRRSKLFFMLLAEDFIGSLVALAVGLPVAVLLSEIISIVTAKLVGMGIIGHQFVVSGPALAFTVVGFLGIKLAAFLILSGKISREEIASLLADTTPNTKKQKPAAVYVISAVLGMVMLVTAYYMAIRGIAWSMPHRMLLTMLIGIVGTILLFYGMRAIIALLVKGGRSDGKLHVFNFRQIQENVIRQSTSMAISSLLILAALCCFGAGIGIAITNSGSDSHVLDYTFESNAMFTPEDNADPDEVFTQITNLLKENGLMDQFSQLQPMRLGNIRTTDEYEGVFKMTSVMDSLGKLPETVDQRVLLNNLGYVEKPYVICLSDYNKLLELAGKPLIELNKNEAAVFIGPDFMNAERLSMLNKILAEYPEAELDGADIHLKGDVQSTNLITDRSITLSFALILPDEQFYYYTQGIYSVYVNGILNKEIVNASSLMNVCSNLNEKLDVIGLEEMGFEYESYLQNMGRQLFFVVAASYITIYLAIIFLVVANTIIGVQFLMNQQSTGRRYQVLVRLGADYKTICQSARKQITWFMSLPVIVAAVGSMFGVKALFVGMLSSDLHGSHMEMLIISSAVIFLLCVIEYIYMAVIKRSSDKYLHTLMQPNREE